MLSDQSVTGMSLNLEQMEWYIEFASLAPINAAISSNCGSVSFLKGATRVFAISKDGTTPLHRCATARYAYGLASANTCLWGSGVAGLTGRK